MKTIEREARDYAREQLKWNHSCVGKGSRIRLSYQEALERGARHVGSKSFEEIRGSEVLWISPANGPMEFFNDEGKVIASIDVKDGSWTLGESSHGREEEDNGREAEGKRHTVNFFTTETPTIRDDKSGDTAEVQE